MSSDNRMLRVKHGGKLFEVLKDQEDVNQQPLSLIETALPRQYADPYNEKIEEEQDMTQKSQINNSQGMIISEYVKDNRFNPKREIQKERNISEFFVQKYQLLNDYLEVQTEEQAPTAIRTNVTTAIMKSRMKKRKTMKKVQSVADLQQKPTFHYLEKKTRAQQFIEQVEKHIGDQVEREWIRRQEIEQEQRKMKEEIKKITEESKRRIQMFVDPRSAKIRENFKVLNQNLAEIRKIDPNLKILQRVSSQQRIHTAEPSLSRFTRRSPLKIEQPQTQNINWKQKSNAEILSEILKIGRGNNSLQ